MDSVTYKNGFYNPNNRNSKEYFTTDSEPIEHCEHFIYKYSNHEYHVVKEGVCINMFAGVNGAKLHLDKNYCLLEKECGKKMKCTIQCGACIGRI